MKKLLPKQYAKILYAITDEKKGKDLDVAITHFIELLQKNQMLSKIDYIVKDFTTYSKSKAGIEELDITSAHKLSDRELKEIGKHFGTNVEATTKVDSNLIGGLVVRRGDHILDGSVKSQLERLKQKLS